MRTRDISNQNTDTIFTELSEERSNIAFKRHLIYDKEGNRLDDKIWAVFYDDDEVGQLKGGL